MATKQLDIDSFVRSNQSGWGTASGGSTWSTSLGTPTLSIASNKGHATNITAQANMQLGSITSQNAEGLVRVTTNNTSSTRMGISLRQTASNTFYQGRLSANANNIAISKIVSGTTTDLQTSAFTVTAGSSYWIRFKVVGTNLMVRAWLDGNSEPSTWNISLTDSSITGAGGFGLTINASSSTTTWDFDSFTVWDGAVYYDTTFRGPVSATANKNTTFRGPISALTAKNTTYRGNVGHTAIKNTTFRGVLSATANKNTTFRGSVGHTAAHDTVFRGNVSAWLLSGGFVLAANGAGTVSFDHFRATQYPDPSLSLAPVLPRIGTSLIAWNANTPSNTTLGMDISTDGVNWTDMSSSNGGSLPAFYSQPLPTIDGFSTNTSANYTSTFRTGGAAGTWTYDTANNRIVATGGTTAIYVNTSVSRADVDLFADLDQADAGGLVWRYIDQNNFYYLLIGDSLASSGTPNTVTLYKVATNVQTQLATAAISYVVGTSTSSYTVTFTRGTYRRFRVNMQSGVITVYVDGVQLLTYTDGSPLGAGLMGLFNNGGTTGSRYYQLWLQTLGDIVTGTPTGDTVTGQFVYTRQRLSTTDATVTPQVLDVTTAALSPNIQAGISIPSAAYNATIISKNYDDLAKQSNYSWYIDQNKNLYFRSIATVAAPWILQSAPTGLVQTVDLEVSSNLELDVQNDLYRNRQTIIGAIGTLSASATFVGDGSTRSFTLGYPLGSAPTITLNGVTQTVGLKGTTGYQWYYAIGDAVLVQDASGTVMQATDTLNVPNYTGQYITNVTVDNTAAQVAQQAIEGGTGIVENVQDETSNKLSVAAATTLAQQLLTRYGTQGRTLIFDTSRDGLAVGMVLSIFFPEEGIIDGQFYINQVEITLRKNVNDAQIWWYKVTCSELPRQASWAKLIASGLSLQ